MNLIQTPIRSNLSSDKSTKMAYIYMNQRQLDKLGSKLSYSTMADIEEEQQVEYEDIALYDDDDGDDDDIKETRELVDKDIDNDQVLILELYYQCFLQCFHRLDFQLINYIHVFLIHFNNLLKTIKYRHYIRRNRIIRVCIKNTRFPTHYTGPAR